MSTQEYTAVMTSIYKSARSREEGIWTVFKNKNHGRGEGNPYTDAWIKYLFKAIKAAVIITNSIY